MIKDLVKFDGEEKKAELMRNLANLLEDPEKLGCRALLPNGLTLRENLFVEFFIANNGNALEAAKNAGYKNSQSLDKYSSELVAKPKIAKQIMQRMTEVLQVSALTPEKVISQLARIATTNIKDVMTWDGEKEMVTLKNSSDVSDEIADAISEVSLTRAAGGHKSIRVKMHNKMEALKELAKLMQLYADPTLHVKISDDDGLSDDELIEKYERELKRSGKLVEPE